MDGCLDLQQATYSMLRDECEGTQPTLTPAWPQGPHGPMALLACQSTPPLRPAAHARAHARARALLLFYSEAMPVPCAPSCRPSGTQQGSSWARPRGGARGVTASDLCATCGAGVFRRRHVTACLQPTRRDVLTHGEHPTFVILRVLLPSLFHLLTTCSPRPRPRPRSPSVHARGVPPRLPPDPAPRRRPRPCPGVNRMALEGGAALLGGPRGAAESLPLDFRSDSPESLT